MALNDLPLPRHSIDKWIPDSEYLNRA